MGRYHTKFLIVITFTIVSYAITRVMTPGLLESDEIAKQLQRRKVQGNIIIQRAGDLGAPAHNPPPPKPAATTTHKAPPAKPGNKPANKTGKAAKKGGKGTKGAPKGKKEDETKKAGIPHPKIFCDRPQIAELFYINRKQRMEMAQQKDDTREKMPKALVIGARHSGTEALLHFLSTHPNLKVPRKEANEYFEEDAAYQLGLRGYYHKMPDVGPNERVVDRAPSYFMSSKATKRVYCFNSTLRMLLILRNPVHRLLSEFVHQELKGQKDDAGAVKFKAAVFKNETLEVNGDYPAVKAGLYASYLREWLQYFSLDQILIIDGEAFLENPVPTLKEAETFLGLSKYFKDKQFARDAKKGYFCLASKVKGKKSKCLGDDKGLAARYPALQDSWTQALSDFYKPHNEQLNELTGRPFQWK